MAKNFLVAVDLNGNELLNIAVQKLAAAPAVRLGGVYYDTVLNQLRVSDGIVWSSLTSGAGYTDEQAQDAVAAALVAGAQTAITTTYNDAGNSIALTITDGAVTNTKVAAGLSADKLVDGTTNKAYTAIEQTKLAGVAAGATVYTDEQAQDAVAAAFAAGSQTGITITYNDAGNSFTLAVAAGSVVDAMISSAAAINADKIANGTANKVYTTGEQTKLAGIASGATAYTNATALANRLDQFAAPNVALSLASNRLINVADPLNPQDAATKAYVDATAQGLDPKGSVRVATTVNGALATAYANASVVDGVTLATGNRILLKNQTAGLENGLYTVNAAGAPTRTTDADTSAKVTAGLYVFVTEGVSLSDTGWVLTTNDAIVLGTTALVFAQFSGSGSYIAGAGLTLTGNSFDVVGGTGITVGADLVSIDTAVVARKLAFNVGDAAATSFVLTHNLNTRDVAVNLLRSTTPWDEVEADIQATTLNTVTVIFVVAPSLNQFRALVVG